MSGLAKSLRIVAGLLLVSLTFAAAACSGEPGEEAAPVAVAPTTTEGASSTATETVADCRDEPVGPVTYRYADRPGVDPSRTSLDVYLPAGCGPVPVVVWVHGGGWRAGDKAFASTAPKVAWANQLGAALVAVNYRLSSPDAGVVWPDHSDDVAAGLAWIGSEGPRIGLNPSDVVMLGHSAGAHLVTLAVTSRDLVGAVGPRVDVRCVVALDTASYDLASSRANERGLVANAFGTDPAVLAAASPLVQVRGGGVVDTPILVVTRGSATWRGAAATFADALTNAGGRAELVDVSPYNHEQAGRQLGVEGEELLTVPVTRFVEGCLGSPPS
jgi:acetyl esterase/lipase